MLDAHGTTVSTLLGAEDARDELRPQKSKLWPTEFVVWGRLERG